MATNSLFKLIKPPLEAAYRRISGAPDANAYLDDVGVVADYLKEQVQPGVDYLANAPLPKAIGSVIANPSPQEVGQQVANVGGAFSEAAQQYVDDFSQAPFIGAMTAYHGTPHKIVGGFKKEAIGTGEGAQAFGHGFYATESPEVAKYYRDTLTEVPYQYKVKGKDAQSWMDKLSMSSKTEDLEWAEVLENILGKHSHPEELRELYTKANGYSDKTVAAVKSLKASDIKAFNESGKEISRGYLYKLDIPEPDVMLDWDKPLSEQPEIVKKALKEYGELSGDKWLEEIGKPQIFGENVKGNTIYQHFVSKYGPAKASEMFNFMGIKGINYPAGSISGVKSSARNFVIFEPEDIKITAEEFLDK